MSGHIYIALPAEKVLAKIESGEIDLTEGLRRSDRNVLCSNPIYRDIIVNADIHPSIQEHLWNESQFDTEVAMKIVKNSTNIWAGIPRRPHEFSSEFLLEYGYKLDLWNIEWQPNIDEAFISKYGSKMDLNAFAVVREERGDMDKFCNHPIIRLKDVSKSNFNYKLSKEDIITRYKSCIDITSEEEEKLSSKIDELLNTPVSSEYLNSLYESPYKGRHDARTIVGYWNNHYRPNDIVFPTWQEFVQYSRDHNCTALPDVVFDDHYSEKIRMGIF